jgi:hypothetical protein
MFHQETVVSPGFDNPQWPGRFNLLSHAYDRSSQTTEIVQQLAARSTPPLGIIICLQLPRFLFHLKKTKIRTKMSHALFFHPQSQDKTIWISPLAKLIWHQSSSTYHPRVRQLTTPLMQLQNIDCQTDL